MNVKTVKVSQKLIDQINKNYYRKIIWSINTDAADLVEYLMRHGYSRRKAFQIFCSFAYASVREIEPAKRRVKKAVKKNKSLKEICGVDYDHKWSGEGSVCSKCGAVNHGGIGWIYPDKHK